MNLNLYTTRPASILSVTCSNSTFVETAKTQPIAPKSRGNPNEAGLLLAGKSLAVPHARCRLDKLPKREHLYHMADSARPHAQTGRWIKPPKEMVPLWDREPQQQRYDVLGELRPVRLCTCAR